MQLSNIYISVCMPVKDDQKLIPEKLYELIQFLPWKGRQFYDRPMTDRETLTDWTWRKQVPPFQHLFSAHCSGATTRCSQNSPVKASGQWHRGGLWVVEEEVGEAGDGTHTPPFWHGFDWQDTSEVCHKKCHLKHAPRAHSGTDSIHGTRFKIAGGFGQKPLWYGLLVRFDTQLWELKQQISTQIGPIISILGLNYTYILLGQMN